MLKVTVPASEYFDEDKNEFFYTKEQTLSLEHSLVSISKWESKWGKPFLSDKHPKSLVETLDYIKCMTLTQNVDPLIYSNITDDIVEQIKSYIDNPMTATWFSEEKARPSREIITSEVIYYWMIELNIPFECQKWHLNRLLTLIKVCNLKRQGNKKMSRREIIDRNRALNEARRKKYNTKG